MNARELVATWLLDAAAAQRQGRWPDTRQVRDRVKRDVPAEIDEAFYAGKRLPAVPFVINDTVEVVRGPHGGRGGAVISIEAMSPTLSLLVELDDGTDAVLEASSLRLVATGS